MSIEQYSLTTLLTALATVLPLGSSQETDRGSETAVRSAVERYYDAFAARDIDRIKGLWAEAAPGKSLWLTRSEQAFSLARSITVAGLRVDVLRRGETSALVRARFRLEGEPREAGASLTFLGEKERYFTLVPADEGYRIWDIQTPEQELGDRLLAADTEEARRKILDAEKGLVTEELFKAVYDPAAAANNRGAYSEVFRRAEAALSVAMRLGDKLMIGLAREMRGHGLSAVNRTGEAREELRSAVTTFRELNQPVPEARARIGLARIEAQEKNFPGARDQYEAIQNLAGGDDALELWRATAENGLGDIDRLSFGYDPARRHYEAALKAAADRHWDLVECYASLGLGLIAGRTGDPAGAREHLRASLKRAQTLGLPQVAYVWNQFALLNAAIGNHDEARDQFDKALEAQKESRDRRGQAVTENNIGNELYASGRYREALEHYRAALALFRELSDRRSEALTHDYIGNSLSVIGRYEDAMKSFREGLDIATRDGFRDREARLLLDIAYHQSGAGRSVEAAESYQKAMRIAAELKDRSLIILVLRGLGDLQLAGGDVAAASDSYQKGLDLAKEFGSDPSGSGLTLGLAKVAFIKGDYKLSLESLSAPLEAARKHGEKLVEATILFRVGKCQSKAMQTREALESFKRSLEIARKLKNNPTICTALENIALEDEAQGRFAAALTTLDEGLKIARDEQLVYREVDLLIAVAGVYRTIGRYKDSLGALNSANSLINRDKLQDVSLMESLTSNLAHTSFRMGNNAEALKLYELALKTTIDHGLRAREGGERLNVAKVHQAVGRFAAARVEADKALAIARDLKDADLEASAQLARSNAEASMGLTNDAFQDADSALKFAREKGLRRREVGALAARGFALILQGRHNEAVRDYEDALAIDRQFGSPINVAEALTDLAGAYEQIGNYAAAVPPLIEAVSEAKKTDSDTIELTYTVQSFPVLYWGQAYAETIQVGNIVVEKARKLDMPEKEATAHLAIAGAYLALRNIKPAHSREYEDRAKEQLDKAVGLTRDCGAKMLEASSHSQLARVWSLKGDDNQALVEAILAVQLAEETAYSDLKIASLTTLGDMYRRLRRADEASKSYREAIRLTELNRSRINAPLSRAGYFSGRYSAYSGLAQSLLREAEPADPDVDEAFMVSERAKARTLVELLASGNVSAFKRLSPQDLAEQLEHEAKLNRLSILRNALLSSKGAETAEIQRVSTELNLANVAYDRFRERIIRKDPGQAVRTPELIKNPAEEGKPGPTFVRLAASAFDRDNGLCILSFLIGDDEILIFVLTRGRDAKEPVHLAVRRAPGDIRDLSRLAGEFRAWCSKRPADGGAFDSSDLYQALLAPVENDLAGKTHLVLIPNGFLETLPFQAIQCPDGARLVDKYPISYAPSVTSLVTMLEKADRFRGDVGQGAGARKPAALVAARTEFPAYLGGNLPFAGDEAKAVAKLFSATPLIGPEATKARVKAELVTARYVHLATHGIVNNTLPMASSVVLTPGPDDDGMLTARELADLDLKAELVAFSSCRTALGEQVWGEGILGLTWSLFLAGCPGTLATQWSVADETTGAVMTSFYDEWRPMQAGGAPIDRARALQKAQLALKRDPRHEHPFFWAPFIVMGAW